ncbi:kynureninase-like isoform X2 [Homarus americanus]|uniref:kynureninase-like isoform X2 n=1 Tax=Homarus americanus TaxID=6706 RepID=UPI001C48247C|nr:kynureninase-like isoform X2 [Homarus americanus]
MNISQETSSPAEELHARASRHGLDVFGPEFACLLDSQDPLRHFRERFAYPRMRTLKDVDMSLVNAEDECLYLCGNSLGLKPRSADRRVQDLLDNWAESGLGMHFQEPLPAASCDRYGREEMGRLVGADPSTVTLMNGLTVNFNLLLLSFYQPTNTRYKVIIEGHAFPSDRYAVVSQAELRGFDPKEAVLELNPRPGEHTLRTEDILKVIKDQGPSIALVCMSGVQYYTGQKFDIATITKAAHDQGCLVGWDLAHAIGNVRINLDDWDVDFACWCTYKYLNSGPGCIAGAYVNKRHNERDAPHLKGWWSNKESTRFQMKHECDVAQGVDSFRLCNPSPFLVAMVLASLEIFEDTGMDQLLQKQFLLTGYLELLLKTHCNTSHIGSPRAVIITPEDVNQRGCQLSLIFSFPLQEIHDELKKRGVVCDIRLPNVMRIAPVPLYNSFQDIHRFIQTLQDVFELCKTSGA